MLVAGVRPDLRVMRSGAAAVTTATLCSHHWDIEPASGHTSRGVCLECGEKRDFLNAVPEDLEYGRTKPRPEVKEGPVKEKRLHGGDITARAKVLKPARRAAEKLFAEGKDIHEVKTELYATFGDIALSTITGWKQRMKPVSHKEAMPEPARSHTETIPLWDTVMVLRPDLQPGYRDRLLAWKKLFDAAFEYLTSA